jgi:hypothetical protein
MPRSRGALNYWKPQFLRAQRCAIRARLPRIRVPVADEPDGARALTARAACPSRPPPARFAAGFNAVIASVDGSRRRRGLHRWARNTYRVTPPYFGTTRYVNYLDRTSLATRRLRCGPNYARLREVKTRTIRTIFHHNVNKQSAAN